MRGLGLLKLLANLIFSIFLTEERDRVHNFVVK